MAVVRMENRNKGVIKNFIIMQDVLFADMPVSEREQHLRDNADQIVERNYTRKFEQEEINQRRAELANVSIQIRELQNELADMRTHINSQIKPLKEKVGEILDELKAGGEWVKRDCYKFVDPEEGRTAIYSPDGYKIEERHITPEERQRTMFQQMRVTGTDNV